MVGLASISELVSKLLLNLQALRTKKYIPGESEMKNNCKDT